VGAAIALASQIVGVLMFTANNDMLRLTGNNKTRKMRHKKAYQIRVVLKVNELWSKINGV
jgi:hypothetical protein